MQSFDEILINIHSKTKLLVRKLAELRIENKSLKEENTQLKQEILAKGKVDLFNTAGSVSVKPTGGKSAIDKDIKEELSKCIAEVKACIDLVQ